MKFFKFKLLLVLFSISGYAQIQIIDNETLKGISYVEVYSSNGDLIGLTDIDGFLEESILNQIKKSKVKMVSFNHLAFDELEISTKNLLNASKIKLIPTNFDIDEILIKGTSTKNKYIGIKGFFRSYQINNDGIKYYMDGEVIYYCPLNNKNKIENHILSHRSFVEKSKKKNISSLILMVGPPRPDLRLTLNALLKKHNTIFVDSTTFKITQKLVDKGKIRINNPDHYTSIEVELVSKSNPKEYKLLGNHSILEYHNGVAYYSVTDTSSLNNTNLLYHKEIRNLKFKRKKDKEFENIEAVHEFYVTKIEFLPNLKKQKKSEDFSFKRNSNYKGKYWEEFTTHKFFKQLPSVLEKAIESKLTELKNLDH